MASRMGSRVRMGSMRSSSMRTPLLHASSTYPELHMYGRTRGPFRLLWESMDYVVLALKRMVREDMRRLIHAFKFALALTLAFLLVLLEAPYEQLGTHVVWAVLTVVVVFELTVGATLSKGLLRGMGTLSAGVLAIVVGELANNTGYIGHPISIGFSVFIIGTIVTYWKLHPPFKSYEYGFRIFLLTFCLILVAEYRTGNPLSTAIHRFVAISIGGLIGLAVNLFVFPCWAGEDLHTSVAKNFGSVADSLEVCVDQYLQGTVLERVPSKILMGLAADDPVYKGYRNALLSASKEESLANFAFWEPPHGQFKMLNFPWAHYVRVGAVLRHCAYAVVALHGCLRSAIQAPLAVRMIFSKELRVVSSEATKVLRELGMQVKNMQSGKRAGHMLAEVHRAVAKLQENINLHSYLLVNKDETKDLVDSLTKTDKTDQTEDLIDHLFLTVGPETPGPNGTYTGRLIRSNSGVLDTISSEEEEMNDHDRRDFKKLNTWPVRMTEEVSSQPQSLIEERVRVLECSGVLAFGTFASLLVEVAARLDYVVTAVEELSNLANFKEAEKIIF